MRLRTYALTREDADRLAAILTRHGGERTLRDLERRHRFWPHMMEAAAAAGVVCIEIRRPATGRPSRVAVLHAEMVNKTPSAKLPLFPEKSSRNLVADRLPALPRRRDLPVPLTIREQLFLMNYWCRNGIGGGFFGACHTWIQLIVEVDAAFDRSWPYEVAHAIRHAHTAWEAKDCLAKLDRFAGREKRGKQVTMAPGSPR